MENVVVIKCGGSTLASLSSDFFEGIAAMKQKGKHPIIVHGGGPAINQMLDEEKVETEFVDGLRKTTPEVLKAAEKVLTGHVSDGLVSCLQQAGVKAIGLSGVDEHLLEAVSVDIEKLGLVGDIEQVNTKILKRYIEADFIPVIAPIAVNQTYGKLNVNADSAASAVAKAMKAAELMFVTDVDGILCEGQLEENITVTTIESFIENGVIYGGMIPKVNAAKNSLTGQIEKVTIANGNGKNKNKDGTLKGTSIVKDTASTF
ncbi:acetylglutamate kinase [Salibacterium salarium]|uniref:Acetylglutamate kinase n=1 Tax=Salibacterium salarium TaxID=284579 RepID=A0A3R9PHV0_9BACI|nr:acetylglutamate kinase [Salibacterium salarium]RSL31016.1 acetylglutamate kinase [Salibacterium salarium]